jgi:stage II sporulation protein GA (sporulation sigma-E factor processing peptidase)
LQRCSTGSSFVIGYNKDNKGGIGQKDGIGLKQCFLDVIWLDNLLINFIVLRVTWKLSGNTSPIWRLWCSACIGACYAILLILPGFSYLSGLPLKLLLSLAMLAAGFRIRSFTEFLKLLGYFYGVTFLLGGAAFGIYYFFNAGLEISGGVFIIHDFPIKILVFSVVFIIFLYRRLWPLLRFRINRQQLVYQVELQFGDKSISMDAFLDTGNELTDPISGCPVIVVEFERIQSILPYEIQKIYLQGREEQLEYITRVMSESTWINRFCIVPYSTLDYSGSILPAFRPDSVRIKSEDGWLEAGETLIGIRNRKLSVSDEYHALIQPRIIP